LRVTWVPSADWEAPKLDAANARARPAAKKLLDGRRRLIITIPNDGKSPAFAA